MITKLNIVISSVFDITKYVNSEIGIKSSEKSEKHSNWRFSLNMSEVSDSIRSDSNQQMGRLSVDKKIDNND